MSVLENLEPNIRWQQFPLLELTVSKLFKLQAAAHLRNTQLLIWWISFFSVVLMDVAAQYFLIISIQNFLEFKVAARKPCILAI